MSDSVRSGAGYTVTQLRYIDWLAASRYERSPTTEQLLAVELGVTDRTLRRWKQLPGFREAITKRARELLGDDLPEIYGALRREAIKGSFPHIKMAMEMTGEYSDTGANEDSPFIVKVLYGSRTNGQPETTTPETD